MNWHRYQEYPIYESCQILKNSKRLFTGTKDVETIEFPDTAELYTFETSNPEWNTTCHEAQISVSRDGNVLSSIEYDKEMKKVKLYVWNVDEGTKKPKWIAEVKNVAVLAESPAIVVSDDGSVISVLGTDGKSAILTIYSYDKSVPIHVWKSTEADMTSTRHLSISKDGGIIAFHLDQSQSDPKIIVYDVKAGKVRWDIDLKFSTNALGLSRNGEFLTFGFTDYYLYKWNGKDSYEKVIQDKTIDNFYVYQTIVENSGNFVLALTSYDAREVIIEYYYKTGELVWNFEYGRSYQLQDVPFYVSTTNDDKYLVIGSWGNQTEQNPQVRVFDVQKKPKENNITKGYFINNPLFSYSTPGSVFCVDIVEIDNVLSIVAGGKHVHANEMGRGGDLFYYEEKL